MFLFLFQWCAGTSLLETWLSTKALSFLGHCLKYCFPEGTGPWPRAVRADPWARTTARTEVCMPITRFMGGWDSSQVSWYMVLNSIAPSKALASMDRCQIILVERGTKMRHFILPWCWHHSTVEISQGAYGLKCTIDDYTRVTDHSTLLGTFPVLLLKWKLLNIFMLFDFYSSWMARSFKW